MDVKLVACFPYHVSEQDLVGLFIHTHESTVRLITLLSKVEINSLLLTSSAYAEPPARHPYLSPGITHHGTDTGVLAQGAQMVPLVGLGHWSFYRDPMMLACAPGVKQ